MAVITLTEKVRFYESVFGSGQMARNFQNFDVRCPICAPRDISKKKLAIHVEDDKNHCWTCGFKAYTLAPLIRKYGSREQLIEYRDKFMPSAFTSKNDSIDNIEGEKAKVSLPDDYCLLATTTIFDPDVLAIKNYLIRRNVSDRDLWKYKLGFSKHLEWKRRVIIPSFDVNGELNLFIGRTIDNKTKPKYEMPGGDRKHVIFNEINVDWTQQIVLCEGAFDMMKCGDNAIPMLGSDINEQSALFNMIIAHSPPIALAMDADMRLTKMPRLAMKLSSYNVDVTVVSVNTDPGDMTKDEFKEALEKARPIEWSQVFTDKLEHKSRMSLRLM